MWSAKVVKTIHDTSGRREVRIVRDEDGSFGFEEWKFTAYPEDGEWASEFWEPVSQGRTFADFPETAEREARSRVDWLISQREPEAESN